LTQEMEELLGREEMTEAERVRVTELIGTIRELKAK